MSEYNSWQNDRLLQLQIGAAQARAAAAVREKKARDHNAAQAYNQGGNAYSLHTVQSRGVGDYNVDQPLTFQVTFVSEPFFTSGAAMVSLPAGATATPWASATVRSWIRDTDGNYSGAYISLHVSAPELDNDEGGSIDSRNYVMTHYLQFQALAYKNLGQANLTAIESLVVKTPGFS